MKEYAVYKGEELLAMGTLKECAQTLGVKPETVRYYQTNAYKRKVAKRRTYGNIRTTVILEADDEEDFSEN